ncbi:MAG: TIGR03960 family B12-binding radical SAM protein [bacterium]|nr:TIGR03960 family B12-binding radical SAM protein [bacterium]
MLPADHPYSNIIDRVLKPGRYTGGEFNQSLKDPAILKGRIALAYPDVYEIGMSHMGLKILYSTINAREDLAAERAYAPWVDMEAELRRENLPLVSLETATPLREFDLLGFSLQYELTYTNILTMLELGGVSRRSADRAEDEPLVVAGGPLTFQPEALAPFFDCFIVGDGEESLTELMDDWLDLKAAGVPRSEALRRLAGKPGRYIPALYEVAPSPDTGLLIVRKPDDPELPYPIERAHVADLGRFPFPTDTPVAETRAIFDRHAIELARGCTEGCRFCQAGMLYRPVRERSPDQVIDTIICGIREAGYDEVSLTSLSTADYSALTPLVRELMARLENEQVSLSVSSLRAYGLAEELLDEIARVRATSLTFAPEAGTQRLRDIINKNITEEQILESARRVFSRKWNSIKLYFMIGLPGETRVDLEGILTTALRCKKLGNSLPNRAMGSGGRPAQVTCAISGFVPKPHTPFQWVAMDDMETLTNKQKDLYARSKRMKLGLKWHAAEISHLEGIICRGDRSIADLIERAYEKGCRFDGWDEHFRFDYWEEAIVELGLDKQRFLQELDPETQLPWNHISTGVDLKFLQAEYRRSLEGRITPPCTKVKGADTRLEPPTDDEPLICYNCGLECDLSETKRRRRDFLDQLSALAEERPPVASADARRYRFTFSRTGNAATMSHLDLVRGWPRSLRRAGLRIAYSQGFHPHPRLSFSPALPMGMESDGEQVEIILYSDLPPAEVSERLQPTLPEGLQLLNGAVGEEKPLAKRLRSLRMHISFDAPEGYDIAPTCTELMARETLPLTRIRKGKPLVHDMRPNLFALDPAEPRQGRTAAVIVELGLIGPAIKAAELVEQLGGDVESLTAKRLGFTLHDC